MQLTEQEKAAGVTVTTINGVEHADYSKLINDWMIENAKICADHKITLDSKNWFVNQVGTGKCWDIKEPNSWATEFPGIPFRERFALWGESISPADLGNLHYGYVAGAMGYGENLTLWGAGYANQLNIYKEQLANGTMTDADIRALPALRTPPNYGDNPDDVPWVKQGSKMYWDQHHDLIAGGEACRL